jgi:hypothetical protein
LLSKLNDETLLPSFRLGPKLSEIFPPATRLEAQPQPVFLFGNSDALVEGTRQSQVLLKTIMFKSLPQRMLDSFSSLKVPADIERSMQQSVLVSHLLDAEQKKTAKIVNPLRPMRPFPRNYGVTEARKK